MSEKYSRIFSLGENLYSEGSPIVIEAGALLKDNESAWIIAQLKLKSIADLQIKTVKVEIKCLDSVGRPIGTLPFEYLDLAVSRGQSFGTQKPIRISDSATRSFEARVVEVGFADNSVWSDTQGVWKSLPKQNDISSRLSSEYAIEGYKSFFGFGAIYEALLANDLWLCSCGEINHSGEEKCHRCNAALKEMLSIEENDLINEGIYIAAGKLAESGNTADLKKAIEEYSKISEYRDSAERISICNATLAKIENKSKKKKRIAIAIPSIVVALGFVGYFAIYPLVSFFLGDYSVPINMYKIKKFSVPSGVTSIGDGAFYDFDSLERVVIPESVTSIGKGAFRDCNNLTSIEIPDGVTSIGKEAFRDCDNLTSIKIPDSVTTIGEYAFWGCTSLTSIKYRGTESQWNAISKGWAWDYDAGDYTITYNYTGD